MSLTGGKRKANKSLKAWVTFVKKVQKEEKLSYKDAIHRAKVRKDKGEKWMMGGQTSSSETMGESMGESMGETSSSETMEGGEMTSTPSMELVEETAEIMGGKRRRTMRRRRGRTQQQQQQQQRQRGRTQRRRQQQQRQQRRASRRQ